MFFASDNGGPVHPKVMEALSACNAGHMGAYGAEAAMEEVRQKIRVLFEAPEAAVYLVINGTACNSLILATLADPWQTIFCSPMAHIHEDECNAPEFFTGGAKLTLVPDVAAKLTPEGLRRAILAEESRGVHGPQRGPVSITSITEKGTVYGLNEIAALSAVCKDFGLPLHLDGARFANAVAALDCTPAEMTWKAGVDAVSFGGTKNGLMGVEAAIFFDPRHAWEFELRRKRGAHLLSKHRYLSAQMLPYLTDDLWLEMARDANAKGQRLAAALRRTEAVMDYDPAANLIFAKMPRAFHKRMYAEGANYYIMEGSIDGDDPDEMLTARFVCDWSLPDEEVDRFIALL